MISVGLIDEFLTELTSMMQRGGLMLKIKVKVQGDRVIKCAVLKTVLREQRHTVL